MSDVERLASRILRGDDLERVLAHRGTEIFRYRSNRPGFIFLSTLVMILVGLAVFIYSDGLTTTLSLAVFSLVVTVALAISSLVAYWTYFARVHFLAVTEQELIVGHRREGLRIAFEDLDLHKLGIEALDGSSTHGILNVHTADSEVPLHLFSPFASLDNLEGFMFQVLTKLTDPVD